MTEPINIIQWNPGLPALADVGARPSQGRELKSPTPTEPSVSADIAPRALLLSEEGLDFDRSRAFGDKAEVYFDLHFRSTHAETLTANGYYSEETQSLEINWNFAFERLQVSDGVIKTSHYEADLSISISKLQSRAVSPFVEKDDIISLVRQLLSDVREVVGKEDRRGDKYTLTNDDLLALLLKDNGRLAKKVEALIQLTVMLARLKQQAAGDQEFVIATPSGTALSDITATEKSAVVKQISFSISHISQSVEGSPPSGRSAIPESPDTAS